MQTSSITRISCALLLPLVACGNALAQERYEVLAGDSDLRIQVFRSGVLARLGHNHVISTSALSGSVVAGEAGTDRSIDIRIPVDSLLVDEPAIRVEEGQAFSAEMSEKDIEGTRENMMGRKLLQADEFDEIRVFSDRISGDLPELTIEAEIRIRGSTHVVELPVTVETYGNRLVASGRAEISHSELGLSPFSAGFGTLRVGEEMIFKYRITARKAGSAE